MRRLARVQSQGSVPIGVPKRTRLCEGPQIVASPTTSCRATATQRQIPFFKPSLGEEEIKAVTETLTSDWLTSGPRVQEFERDFAACVHAPYTIAVCTATAALHLALEAMGVGPGDDVLVPTMTWASAVAVVIHLGAKPVFVDCLADTLAMDPDDLERRITPRSKVAVPMHYAGQPCQMDRIHEISRQHHLRVLEDAAHALPAQYNGNPIGSISEASCFSFYANKTMTTGEGGMLSTLNEDLATRMRLMAYNGINRNILTSTGVKRWWRYDVVAPGFKANMSDISAAIGIQQLKKTPGFWEARQRCAEHYAAGFGELLALQVPKVLPNVRHAWHLYVVQLQLDQLRISRDEFSLRLDEMGVGNCVHYRPLHLHSYYRETYGYEPEDLPVATAAYDRVLSLPIFASLADNELDQIIECVAAIATEFRR
jgi:dTDP-4-amino-4,6-dideoxygalactose transaminase